MEGSRIEALLGILIGAVATVFALIAGTAVLLFQQVSDDAPTSLQFFPVGQVVSLLALLLTLLIADSWLYLISDPTLSWFALAAKVLLAGHAFAGSVVVWFVASTRRWLEPSETIKALTRHIERLSKVRPDQLEDRRIGLLHSLNELAATYVQKRHFSAITPLLKAYSKLIKVKPPPPPTYPEGKSAFSIRVSKSLAQIGVNLSTNHLEPYVPDIAECYMDLLLGPAKWLSDDPMAKEQKEALKFLSSIDRLQSELLHHHQGEALVDFLQKIVERAAQRAGTDTDHRDLAASVLAELYLRSLRLAISHQSRDLMDRALEGLKAEADAYDGTLRWVSRCAQLAHLEHSAYQVAATRRS